MASGLLPNCGHPVGWLIRLRLNNEQYNFCWGCVLTKLDIADITGKKLPVKTEEKKVVKKVVKTEE